MWRQTCVPENERQHEQWLDVLRDAIARTHLALQRSRTLLSRLSACAGDERRHDAQPRARERAGGP
jgi:hypothetical protein